MPTNKNKTENQGNKQKKDAKSKQKVTKKTQEERNLAIKEKKTKIKEDLQNQLISQNKFGAQFDDLIEHYLYLVELKDILKYDIKDNGIRYEVITGNGYTTVKANESVKNLATISGEMRKILEDLNLKEPESTLTEDTSKEGEGDDLL